MQNVSTGNFGKSHEGQQEGYAHGRNGNPMRTLFNDMTSKAKDHKG
jgi:hypothetical protein